MKPLTMLALVAALGTRLPADTLYDAFRDPAQDSRPFVRWWWNGARVDETEIARELDVLQAAGIGGVEINTIGMPEGASATSLAAHPAKPWLSPEWNDCVRFAANAARARGLTTDLIVGSGWPFGGQFLRPEEQTQRVLLAEHPLRGPARVHFTRAELLRPAPAANPRREPEPEPTRSELVFVRLAAVTAPTGGFTPGDELLGAVERDGAVTVDVPAGDHMLLAGIRQFGFTHVKLGAPGADGPVVNHFDAGAVRKYLDHMTERLRPALGGRLSPALRALFVDSLELDHANWTGDFAPEFQRRRGYDLLPYLPYVLQPDRPAPDGGFNETIRRARYDFDRTLVELFAERFLATFRHWARDNGVQGRIQAYGRESHPLEGSMQADLPEGESWLWLDPARAERIRVESTVVNKYVASAANLTGQRVRTFEAMTNAVPVFRETLQDFKRTLDATLLDGLNQPVIHGFNYTPPDAGFPGWVRFGSYLNDRTPWWPYFRQFTDYAARLGTVLRQTTAPARVALLAPRPEEWARHGLLYQPFPEVADPWYQFSLIHAVQQAGFNADYVSERILVEGRKSGGRLQFGPCAYDLLVLLDVADMEPTAAAALAEFVTAGGQVIVVGRPPSRAPGLKDAAANDALVRAAADEIRRVGGPRVHFAAAPVRRDPVNPAADEADLLSFAKRILGTTGLVPDVRFAQPRVEVSQLTLRDGPRWLYFLANRDADAALPVRASFPAATGRAYRWDPLTGTRQALATDATGELAFELGPVESALIAFEPAEAPLRNPAAPAADRVLRTLTGPWKLELVTAATATSRERSLPALVDFSRAGQDEELRYFGGTATYAISFDGAGLEGASLIDLGEVHSTSEVSLNGIPLGSRWWGRHRYAIGQALQPGHNELRIKVSTVLANLMQHKVDDPVAQRWASWAPPIPAGLVGPVRLVAAPATPP